jgi:hypothetical protein
LAFLKRGKSIPLLAGDIVHEQVSLALRCFRDAGAKLSDLAAPALRRFDSDLALSLQIAQRARKGLKPQQTANFILDHLVSGERSEAMEEAGRQVIRQCLTNFEASEAWEAIRATDTSRWQTFTSTDDRPHFTATADLGFLRSAGVRVYTAFDLTLVDGDDLVIVDWKSGKKTHETEATTNKQLAGYCLWAISKGYKKRHVKVQPVYLLYSEPWKPRSVTRDELTQAIDRIEEHYIRESQLIRRGSDEDWNPAHVADRADFLPRPHPSRCGSCKFRPVCSAAKPN